MTSGKCFHPHFCSKKVQWPTIGPLVNNEEWTVQPLNIANHFVAAFSAVFTDTDLTNPFPLQYCNSKFLFKADSFDIFKIHEIVLKVEPSTNRVPEGVPSIFLKKFASIVH